MESKTKVFEQFVQTVICIFAIFLTGVLSIASLFSTTSVEIVEEGQEYDNIVNRIQPGLESILYYHDNIFANLIWLAVGFAICFFVMPFLHKLSFKQELLFVMLWTGIIGIIWVYSSQSAPSEDSSMVVGAGVDASRGKYDFMELPYFCKFYPFQLGYVFFCEVLARIRSVFGEAKTLLYMEVINVLLLCAIYAGILKLEDMIFENKNIRHLTAFLLLFSFQPLLFCSFLYGIYPGMTLAVWALVLEMQYFQKQQPLWLIGSAVLISLAYLVKPNYLIFLIAMLILAFVKLFENWKQKLHLISILCYMVLAFTLSMILPNFVQNRYERLSGVEITDTMPMISYITMGMQEASNAPGWYNYGATMSNFEAHNFQTKPSAEYSIQEIKNRWQYFQEHKSYRNEFFYKKFVSQWNETSYESIWTNIIRYQYDEKRELASWVCGAGQPKVKAFMDLYSQLIFAGVFLGSLVCLKKGKSILQTAFPLIMIGGMMYHLLSEAKSQYSIPYFILMTGFSAVGICMVYEKSKRRKIS